MGFSDTKRAGTLRHPVSCEQAWSPSGSFFTQTKYHTSKACNFRHTEQSEAASQAQIHHLSESFVSLLDKTWPLQGAILTCKIKFQPDNELFVMLENKRKQKTTISLGSIYVKSGHKKCKCKGKVKHYWGQRCED